MQADSALTQRRRFIQLLGGGAVVAAAPLAAGGCSGSALPAAAIRPWTEPADAGDSRRWMLAHALLAPNPHNRQPWIADLASRPDAITLICDGSRLLPETDPFGRQIIVGCGAFVELAVIAAAERGVRVQVQAFPDGEPATSVLPAGSAVARLVLTPDPGVARDPLFAQIRRRHTNKGAYDSAKPVPAGDWPTLTAPARALQLSAGAVNGPEQMAALRRITRAAYEIEMTTPRTWLESARLLRIGSDDIERHRDGISVTGTMPWLLRATGLFDPFEVPVPGSSNHGRVMERWLPFETGSGYLWIASRGNGRQAQFDSGRAYVRAHLQATAAGIDLHPLSQALQEFAEVRAQHDALHRLLGLDPQQQTLQMLARAGYGQQAAGPSPRRDAASLVRA